MHIAHASLSPASRLLPAALLGAALALGLAGCGHSEEEWQVMLNRYRELETRCQPGSPAAFRPPEPGGPGCSRDVDCKGNRVCNVGRCAPPY
jgi:hypothetical protein